MSEPSCPSKIRGIISYYIINFGNWCLPFRKANAPPSSRPPPLKGTHGFQLAAIKLHILKPESRHVVEAELHGTSGLAVCTPGGRAENAVSTVRL